jgi:hypothetical protein
MLVIMLNCVTLGMFQPCEDVECRSERCNILEVGDAGWGGTGRTPGPSSHILTSSPARPSTTSSLPSSR